MCRVLSGIVSVFLIFGLITLPANAAPVTAPLGVVVAADQAKVGNNKALIGSTIFQGDLLVTEAAGQMQVRFDGTQARLLPGSVAVVNRLDSGVNAALLSGSVSMASPAGGTFSLSANGALVRPAASQAVAAQVTRVSPNELLLSSSKGALEVVFDGEVTTIDAGSSYRMLLDPAAAEPQGPVGTRAAGRSKRRVIFIAVAAAAAATGIAIIASQSSSSPVSPSAP